MRMRVLLEPAGPGSPAAAALAADAESNGKTLVVLELSGGNDGLCARSWLGARCSLDGSHAGPYPWRVGWVPQRPWR